MNCPSPHSPLWYPKSQSVSEKLVPPPATFTLVVEKSQHLAVKSLGRESWPTCQGTASALLRCHMLACPSSHHGCCRRRLRANGRPWLYQASLSYCRTLP